MRAHSLIRPLALGAALAGCSLFTDFGELSDTPDGGTTPEAGGSDTTTPPVDASGVTDAIDEDRSTPVDAGGCPAFAIFCDDFENGNFTKWTSLLQTNGGAATVVDTPTFAGKHAARSLAPASTGIDASNPPFVSAGFRLNLPNVVTTGATLVVRAHVRFPKALFADTTFLKISAKNSADDMNLKTTSTGGLKVDTDVASEGPELVASKGPLLDTWFCIEWQTTIGSGSAGHQRVLLDGEVILDANENNFTPDGYDQVTVGLAASEGSVTQDIFVDDVAMANQPIGCP